MLWSVTLTIQAGNPDSYIANPPESNFCKHLGYYFCVPLWGKRASNPARPKTAVRTSSKPGSPGPAPAFSRSEAPFGVNKLGQALKPKDFVPRADLMESNLSGIFLNRPVLSEANLGNATMRKIKMSHANLRRANLRGADLYAADLSHAILTEADLSGANLAAANLSRADLTRANLHGADLSGANCMGARLQEADLSDSILAEVDFPMAFFRKAMVLRANLHKANLCGAYLYEAQIENCDLREAVYDSTTIPPSREFDWGVAQRVSQKKTQTKKHHHLTHRQDNK